jgi:hypothetical protein
VPRGGADRPGQLQAVQAGHLEVGQHQGDVVFLVECPQRFDPVPRRYDAISNGFQDAAL